jgi:hypothetical protein
MQQDNHRYGRIDTSHRLRPFEVGEGEAEWEDSGHESAGRRSDADWDAEVRKQRQTQGSIRPLPSPSRVSQSFKDPRAGQQRQKRKLSPHPAPPPPKREQASKDHLSLDELLAKVTRMILDIAILDDVIFV